MAKEQLSFVLISEESFPTGGAACNRHMAFASALVRKGHRVHLYSCNKSQLHSLNTIFCHHTYKFLNMYIHTAFAQPLLCLMVALKLLLQRPSADLVFYLGTRGISALILLIVCSVCGIRLIHERTEHPQLMSGSSIVHQLDFLLYRKFALPHFNHIFVITQNLRNFFISTYFVDPKSVSVLNMVVDFTRFPQPNEHNSVLQKIVFCGDLSSAKDGIEDLVNIFNQVNAPLTKLIIIGDSNATYFHDKVKPLCGVNVVLTGFLERPQVVEYLCNADLLVLFRSNSMQNQYGFPTKLGEYLATGKPVLVTATGEIAKYLVHLESAILVEPDDFTELAKQLDQVILNYEVFAKVGFGGREIALLNFNADTEVLKIAAQAEVSLGA